MDVTYAFGLFNTLIANAQKELLDITEHTNLSIKRKADNTTVTQCDLAIDEILGDIATQSGFKVISEENDHSLQGVTEGTYMTVDPIDGTLGYIDHVNQAVLHGNVETFLNDDIGPNSDFCLLLGIVENGQPKYGACYNYVTREKILIDGSNRDNLLRTNIKRQYSQKNAVYTDPRPVTDKLTDEIKNLDGVSVITEGPFGLRALYTILNPHESAVTVHRAQVAGVWDIVPAAAAACVFGGNIYDELGETLKLNRYVFLPGKGATVVRGRFFENVITNSKLSSGK
jgi:fructose-1,6-bisphosphatase/inositol monophosphatase family enzyme